MTALSIVQSACRRLGLDVPSALFSSTDPLIVQMIGLMNESVSDIANEHMWSFLIDDESFTATTSATIQSYTLDAYQYYVNDTMYNTTQRKKILGPMTPQEWARMRGLANSTIDQTFRFTAQKAIEIYPQPSAADTIIFTLYNKTPISVSDSAGGTDDSYVLPRFMSTSEVAALNLTDTTPDYQSSIINEELITQWLVWKWKQKKGFDYSEDFVSAQKTLEIEIGRDGGRKSINLSGSVRGMSPNVPESGFGS